MLEDEIIESCGMRNLKCCSCGAEISPCADVNVVATSKRAFWECPIYGSFDDPNFPPRALAIVCDKCARAGAEVTSCVEFRNNDAVKYHTLENLNEVNLAEVKMKHYFGKNFVLSLLARKEILHLPERRHHDFHTITCPADLLSVGLPPSGYYKERKEDVKMDDSGIKKSDFQVVPAENRPGPYQVPETTQWSKRKMDNPVYYRLESEAGNFVGFKRIVTEYLPAAATKWQLDEFPHSPERTEKLSTPAMGTATFAREKIVTTKQRRVGTGPKTTSSPTDLELSD